MKCINESCGSTDIKIISDSDGNIVENAANLFGAAVCAIACLSPFHYAASKATQQFWRDGTRSVKVVYKCNKCGCTWSETKWM